MIISASYKTDIPAFYGTWFMNRLSAGFCRMLNPYNRRPIYVSLAPADADGFVFWTKNLTPFLQHLPEVRDRGFPFVVQYTINGYPRALETSVVDAGRSIENMHKIASTFGPSVGVWRYDTILDTSLTPMSFHRDNFAKLAAQLRGATDEVVISFAQFYRKTLRNVTIAGKESDFTWRDPELEEKRSLVAEMVAMAQANGMTLTICSQRDYLVPGARDARCIDVDRFESIIGRKLIARLKGNRKECGCHESRDIGEYDTCPHGCVYCYAVWNRDLAQRRFKRHDPDGEFLFLPQSVGALSSK